MITAEFGYRADAKPLVFRESAHLLCIGCSGAGKSKAADALMWGMLRDNPPNEDFCIIINNPKMVGFEWAAKSPRVKLYSDLTQFESVWTAVWAEVQRRYALMKIDEDGTRVLPNGVGALFVFTDELPSVIGNEGALLPPASVKSIKDDMLKVLRLGRQARVYALSFSQFAEGGNVGGTAARALYDNRICMRVTSDSEVTMATGISESEVGNDNLTTFLPGEVLARLEKGVPFVRGWSDHYTDKELNELVEKLPTPKTPDFGFLAQRGLA